MKYFEKKKLIPLRIINLKFEKNIELIKLLNIGYIQFLSTEINEILSKDFANSND